MAARPQPEPERRLSDAPPEARVSPNNIEAERACLGALLLHSDLYEQVATRLQPRDFFRQAHQQIYAAMVRLLDVPGGALELVTLANELAKRDELPGIGGKAYLASLVDGLPRSTNIVHYADVVREKSLYRGLITAGRELQRQAADEEELPEVLIASAETRLVELQRLGGVDRMTDVSAGTSLLLADLMYRVEHQGELTGVPTGFPTLDQLTQGWQAGDVIVLAARPSMGKTTLVLNCAMEAARLGKTVAVFSMEMRARQLEYRMLSGLSGVPLTLLQRGRVAGDEQFAAIGAATAVLEQCPVHIDDAAARTVRDVRRACRRLRSERGLDLVVIDYIQLMAGTLDRRGATRNEELTDISRRLKVLAGELNVPILVLSQLNRAAESRADSRPRLSDLRESGALEQDADLVMFIHRKDHRQGGETHLIVEKQRNGPTGTLALTAQRELTLFTDGGLAEETRPQPAAEPQTPEEAEDARMQAEKAKWARKRRIHR